MDKDVESHSQIIPVSINKNGSIGRYLPWLQQKIFKLIDHVESLIKEIARNMKEI